MVLLSVFQLSMVNHGPKILMENSRTKQFKSFELHMVLSSVMKSQPILLHPPWDMNHPPLYSVYMLCMLPALWQLGVHSHKTFITVYCYNCSILGWRSGTSGKVLS